MFGVFAAVFAVAIAHFGMVGARLLLAMIIFFFAPFYFAFRNFNIDSDEKVFFSFFIGIGIFSALVFFAGRLVPGFRISSIAVLLALFALPFVLKKVRRSLKK